jgi:hypothetical protein
MLFASKTESGSRQYRKHQLRQRFSQFLIPTDIYQMGNVAILRPLEDSIFDMKVDENLLKFHE